MGAYSNMKRKQSQAAAANASLLATAGDPEFLARHTDSQAQTPSAYAEAIRNQRMSEASNKLATMGSQLSGGEREDLLEISQTGEKTKTGMFMKLMEVIDRPRELVSMGIADVFGLDNSANVEIKGRDYWDSFMGRDDTLRDRLGEDLAGDSGFGFPGAKLWKLGGVESDAAAGVLGFGTDVLVDPTTYVGSGFFAGGKKAAIEGIELGAKTSVLEGFLHVLKGSADDALEASSRHFADDITEAAARNADVLEDGFLARLAGEYGDDIPIEVIDGVREEARRLALLHEGFEINKVLPDAQKVALEGFGEGDWKIVKEMLGSDSKTVVANAIDRTKELVGGRQFKTLRGEFPDLVKHSATPNVATGGLKAQIPFSRHALDLGLATDAPIRSAAAPYIGKFFEAFPVGFQGKVRDVWLKRGWEIPGFVAAEKGQGWQLSAALQGQRDELARLGLREKAGVLSVSIKELRKAAETAGFDADQLDPLVSRALSTPNPQGVAEILTDPDLYKAFDEHITLARGITDTIGEVYRVYDPEFKMMEGYLTMVKSQSFGGIIDRIRSGVNGKGISLRAPASASPEVQRGLSLLNDYVAAANVSASKGGAADAAVSRFAKSRKSGKAVFTPFDIDSPVHLVDRDEMGALFDIGNDVGFVPTEDINKSIAAAVEWLGENRGLKMKGLDASEAFSMDVSQVLDSYIQSMTDAISYRSFIEHSRRVGLITRQEFATDVQGSLVALSLAVESPQVREIIEQVHRAARGSIESLDDITRVNTTRVSIGGIDIEVDARVAATPQWQEAAEKASARINKAREFKREVIASQEAKVRELVAEGIPEQFARPMAVATTDQAVMEARVAMETDAYVRAAMLEQVGLDAAAKARTPAELIAAEKTIEATRRQAASLRRRAKRQADKIQDAWAKEFSFPTEIEELSHMFDFNSTNMPVMADLITKQAKKEELAGLQALEGLAPELKAQVDEHLALVAQGLPPAEVHSLVEAFAEHATAVAERSVAKQAQQEVIDIVTVSNLSWGDVAEVVSPQGLYDLVRHAHGKGATDVTTAVTKWRNTVAKRGRNEYKDTISGLLRDGVGDSLERAAANDAVVAFAESKGIVVADLFKGDKATLAELFGETTASTVRQFKTAKENEGQWLGDLLREVHVRAEANVAWQGADGVSRRLPLEDARNAVESRILSNVVSAGTKAQHDIALGSMIRMSDPHSADSRMLAALRRGLADELVPFEGRLREWMGKIGMDSGGITFKFDPKTKQHTISYSQVSKRETFRMVSMDTVNAEIETLFPGLKHLKASDKVGFLKDMATQAPATLEKASPELRYFIDQIDELGAAAPQQHLLSAIDEMNAKAQGLTDVANMASTQLKAQYPDVQKAWPKVRKSMKAALEGGSVANMRKTWAANEKAVRNMSEELANQTQYMVDHVAAVRGRDIPKSMIDRNMRASQSQWGPVGDTMENLAAFSEKTAEMLKSAEFEKLADTLGDFEEFRAAFMRLTADFGGSAGEAGAGLRNVTPNTVFTLDGVRGEQFASRYAEVSHLAERIGKNIEGTIAGMDMEEVARLFPALPNNPKPADVDRWLAAKLRPLTDADLSLRKSPVSEGFVPAEAFGLASGQTLQNEVMDTWMAIHLENMVGGMRAMQTARGLGAFSENANAAVRWWKTAATIGRPTFVLRNIMGASYNNMLIGVGAREYQRIGANTVKLRRAFAETGNWEQALAKLPEDAQGLFRGLVDSQLMDAGFNRNLQHVIEDTAPNAMSTLNPLNINDFKPFQWNAQFMQTSEDFMRAAAFARYYDPANPASAQFARDMALAVHFDYENLSTVEQGMKRLVPFFVWSRRNLPLQVQAMVERPGMATRYKHLMVNIEESQDDSVADGFADSQYLSGFAARTGITMNADTPFWARIILDPDVPIKDLDEALGTLGEEGVLKWASGFLNPGITMPFDLQASAEFGDVNAPAGLHTILKGLHAIGLWDNTAAVGGDPQVSYNTRSIAETVVPFAGEYSNLTGTQNDPKRQAKLGIDNSDGVGVAERLRAMAVTLSKAGGVQVQTPQDQLGASFDAGAVMKDILADAELQGRLDRGR